MGSGWAGSWLFISLTNELLNKNEQHPPTPFKGGNDLLLEQRELP